MPEGLWPDRCDGSFDQFCAPARESTNITQVLLLNKETEILKYMQKFWKDNTGKDEVRWPIAHCKPRAEIVST